MGQAGGNGGGNGWLKGVVGFSIPVLIFACSTAFGLVRFGGSAEASITANSARLDKIETHISKQTDTLAEIRERLANIEGKLEARAEGGGRGD